MISWKKIHSWMVKELEEPLLKAELHRTDMLRVDAAGPGSLEIRLKERDKRKNPNRRGEAVKSGKVRDNQMRVTAK
ncbi:hypothetical protein DCCM_2640 [Desulfocucumis palustris]|uniref:Uncharacterized protein n=1 Tax=Desulfocucumis palustris TaxID=1898651 RepID=A0A2L2XBF5_9FIRM|nr:hypothetical protein [Desulfocucumis palustris]GBF33538.1 hypothetical protein DCCM_2640 [Desulfocucumis palustris]